MDIRDELKRKRIFFDGGMGSMLQERGLLPGELPETWNLSHPEAVKEIHLEYLRAGADVVTANTFGANGFKYKKDEGYSLGSIVTAGVSLAKEAVKEAGHGYAALDLGPTGRLLAPCGDLDFEDACKAYKEVVEAGVRAGADLIVIETMGDSYELKAAVLAAKEVSSLPVFATVTLDEKGKMLTGGTVETAAALLEGLGADVIGLNCGLGPVQLLPFMKRLQSVSSLPLMVNPNAGLPRSENGRTVYDIDACGFARLDAVKQPRHIAPECAHGLQTLEVLLDVLRVRAVDHVPVGGAHRYHVGDTEVLAQSVQTGGGACPTGGGHRSAGLSGEGAASGVEYPIQEGQHPSAGVGVIDRCAEYEAVGLPGLGDEVVDAVIGEYAAVLAALVAADAVPDGAAVQLHDLVVDALTA